MVERRAVDGKLRDTAHRRPALAAGSGSAPRGTARPTYERIARFYDLLDLPFERGRYATIRATLFQGLEGRILDAGVGTGRNIPHYPAGARMVGIDLSRAMLMRAARRRDAHRPDAALAEMDVLRTAFADSSFDAAVASFLFCVLDRDLQRPALAELARIVRPGGEIRLLDYCRSQRPARRLAMTLWTPWVRWAYGAAFDREPHRHAAAAGLTIAEDRFLVDDILRYLVFRPA